jgi:CelD/BcsL family acetyltransferase involved in cellulose biosynthesis
MKAGKKRPKNREMRVRSKFDMDVEMQVRVIATPGEFQAIGPAWDQLHKDAAGTVFQTHSWLTRWWEIYPNNGDVLQIITVWQGARLIGVLPVYLKTTHLVLLKLTQLRFLGISDSYGEYAPLAHPDFLREVSRAMADVCCDMLRAGRCDTLSFFRFAPDSELMQSFMRDMALAGMHIWFTPIVVPRMMMPLPETWEEYFESLSPAEQKILKRRTRALMNRDVHVEVITGPTFTKADFDDFVRLHTAAWVDDGMPGYYKGSPRFEQFHRQVLEDLAPGSAARIYFFSQDGVRFAAVQAFFVNGTCCFYLSGMDRHHPLAAQSPGRVLLSFVIRRAIEEGCTLFDFQGGKEEYKLKLGGVMTSFAKSLIWPGGFSTFKVYTLVGLQLVRYFVRTVFFDETILRLVRRLSAGKKNPMRG